MNIYTFENNRYIKYILIYYTYLCIYMYRPKQNAGHYLKNYTNDFKLS